MGLEDDRWCLWDHVEPKEGRLVIFPLDAARRFESVDRGGR